MYSSCVNEYFFLNHVTKQFHTFTFIFNFFQMMKDLHKDKDKSKRKSKITEEKDMPISNSDIIENDILIHLHCQDMTVRQLEFIMVSK